MRTGVIFGRGGGGGTLVFVRFCYGTPVADPHNDPNFPNPTPYIHNIRYNPHNPYNPTPPTIKNTKNNPEITPKPGNCDVYIEGELGLCQQNTNQPLGDRTMSSRKADILTIVIVLAMIVIPIALISSTAPGPQAGPQGIADQVEQVRSAVVCIERVGQWQGSGAIISPDGIVFTAKHVTDGTPGDYTVTLDDQTTYKVKYVIEDTENDIAFMLLDLDGHEPNLPTVPLATQDDMRVGDPLFIMGSPLGYPNFNSVSLGILAADNRDLYNREGWGQYKRYDWHIMFQSTSPAFPGNSGGPVFNLRGEVIGVLVAGQGACLNYSVPVARFRGTIDAVRNWFQLLRLQPVEEEAEPEYYGDEYDTVYPWLRH